MKNLEIYNKWSKFIEKYKEYFISNEEEWNNNLNKVKEYIDVNNKRPAGCDKNENIKVLGSWIGTQLKNYKTKTFCMANLEIYNEWSKYFSSIIKPQHNIIDNSTLILPMAGYGSRFSKKGNINPKPLIDVNGLPMIIQAVNCLPTTYKKIFICLNDHLRFYDLDKILLNSYSNTSIYSINKVTQGQACTCQIGITNSELDMNTSILISACDNGVYYDVNKYQALLDNNEIDVIVWSFRNNSASKTNPNMYAWLEVDENDYVKSVSCKNFDKSKHDIKNSHVIIGTMYFRKAVYFLDGLQQNYNENKKQMMNFM